MASATKISNRTIVSLATASVAVAGLAASKADLKSLMKNMVLGPGKWSRIVALVVVVANLKNFPLMWHIRVLSAIFKHMKFSYHKFSPVGNGPSSLFQPVITSTRSPLTECDYNLHKSNSTYFSDLDVTRSNLVCCLLREGIEKLNKTPGIVITPDGTPATGRWGIMLGAVQCSFKKEIAPYQPYEMWSRILCWDRKWIYVVTHFVKTGAVKPAGYSLHPPSPPSFLGSPPSSKILTEKGFLAEKEEHSNGHVQGAKTPNKDAIFASAISKYVMKLGRLTIHPEVVMEASGLLPSRPGGWHTMSGSSKATTDEEDGLHGIIIPGPAETGMDGAEEIKVDNKDEIWDWRRIEAENARGMKFAEHFAALDGLGETFTGEERMALGRYVDIL